MSSNQFNCTTLNIKYIWRVLCHLIYKPYLRRNFIGMTEIKKYSVLEYIVEVLGKAIVDAKVQNPSESTAVIKDGNDMIHLEQSFDGVVPAVFIKDPKEIIFSEDLLEPLKNIHKGAKGELKAALQSANIVINDLDVETQLIFQAVKGGFDELSNSYEFLKTTKREITKVTSQVKFGKHVFEISIVNEPEFILVMPDFATPFDPAVKKTIEGNALEVQTAITKAVKEDKVLNG